MVSVAEFTQFVKSKAFPTGLNELDKLKTADDVAVWRKMLFRELLSKPVKGEAIDEQLDFIIHPQESQEESKDELTMPKRVYLAAKSFTDEVAITVRRYAIEKQSIIDFNAKYMSLQSELQI